MKRLIQNIKIAFQSLFLNKTRSFLTMLGIIIGVGAVVAMMSIGTGAQESVLSSVQDIGSNLIIITPGNPDNQSGGYESMLGQSKDAESLDIEDAEALKDSDFIKGAAPVILSSSVISYQNNNTMASIQASTDEALGIYNFEIDDGIFYTSSDVSNSSNVAVIGQTVVKNLFNNEDPIGKILKVGDKNFTIIGTTKEEGADSFGNDQDNVVSIPVTTAQKKIFGIDYVHMILAQSIDEDSMDAAVDDAEKILRRSNNIGPLEDNDFAVQSQTEILDIVGSITNIFTIVIASIAGISLLVGGIGIMNIMLVSVTERTREIGIRKAIGAKNRDILVQFLIESIVLSISGGIAGIIFAVLIAIVLNNFTILNTSITTFPIILALSFSTVIGLFFGIYPAMRAARLNPIDALRYE